MKLLRKASALFDSINGIMAFLAGAAIIFITLAVSIDVSLRYFMNRPITWVFEVCEYLLLFITIMAAAWVLKDDKHVKMDIVLVRLRHQSQAVFNFATSAVCAAVCCLLVWYSAGLTLDHYQRNVTMVTVLTPPKWPIIAIIIAGGFLFAVQFMRKAYGYFREMRGNN